MVEILRTFDIRSVTGYMIDEVHLQSSKKKEKEKDELMTNIVLEIRDLKS